MDNPVIYVAIIVAVIVGAMFLSRGLRRSVSKSGSRYGRRTTDDRVNGILAELAATIVIHAPEPAARDILDRVVLQQPRKFSLLDDGGYGVRFVEADDAVVRLVDDAEGTRMQVVRTTERLGMPQNLEFWRELRSRVTAGAEAQTISVADGPQHSFARHDGDPVYWEITRESS
ncbi:hypothetical protein ACI3KT_17240 [Microbacterium sp. ZW T6_19]|uniref:hypothetical protein n=1 Tax=Microbacterium sp. ZW T6_19 TaxID=3378082 RepID=UPI0038551302